MDKLTASKKLEVIKYYFSGLPFGEIAEKSRVGKGSVSNVIGELKSGKIPEASNVPEQIEMLRTLSLDLKRSGMTPGKCALGQAILLRIREYGLDPADISRWSLILNSVKNEDEAKEFVELVYRLQDVQKKTGLSLEALEGKARESEAKATGLEATLKEQEKLKKEVSELESKRDELTKSITGLDRQYKQLSPSVDKLEKREKELSRSIAELEPKAQRASEVISTSDETIARLAQIGFSLEKLNKFTSRAQVIAQKHHIKSEDVLGRFLSELEKLDEGLDLETQINKEKTELKKQELEREKTKKEIENLKSTILTLIQDKTGLQDSIKETREKMQREFEKMVPEAKAFINDLTAELKRGLAEANSEIQQLQEKALETGKEIGRFQGIIESNEYLNDLLGLVRGEDNIKASRVRVIVSSVVRGLSVWLTRCDPRYSPQSSLVTYANALLQELDRWKV